MQSSRPHNRRLVLETIRHAAPLSRTDLARLTGLTNQSVTNLVELLLAEGLVQEAGRRAPTRGQPARDLVLRPQGALAAGFHLDRRSWSWTVTDLAGTPLARREGGFDTGTSPAELEAQWSAAWDQLHRGFPPGAPFWGVGVAGPGPQDAAGVLRSPPDFPGWDGVDLKAVAERITGLPAQVENDARAAAVGELWSGWGRTHRDFLYLYCSWGFGLGVVLDGALWTGTHGVAGEVGDLVSWPVEGPFDAADRAARMVPVVDPLVKVLDVGAVVIGGAWSAEDRRALAGVLAPRWAGVPVLVSPLDDAAGQGAATLALWAHSELQ